MHASVAGALAKDFLDRGGSPAGKTKISNLSEQEQEVLTLIAEGLSNKQIGESLGISPKTVARHRDNITRKLNLSSRAELTRIVNCELRIVNFLLTINHSQFVNCSGMSFRNEVRNLLRLTLTRIWVGKTDFLIKNNLFFPKLTPFSPFHQGDSSLSLGMTWRVSSYHNSSLTQLSTGLVWGQERGKIPLYSRGNGLTLQHLSSG